MSWLTLVIVGAVLWLAVAIWRMILFVASDMVDFWRNGQEYNDMDHFKSALWAGFIEGFLYPITAPFKLLGTLLWNLAFWHASKVYAAKGGRIPVPTRSTEITDEIEKIPPMEVPETRMQRRLRLEAEEARREYRAKHRAEETAGGDDGDLRDL